MNGLVAACRLSTDHLAALRQVGIEVGEPLVAPGGDSWVARIGRHDGLSATATGPDGWRAMYGSDLPRAAESLTRATIDVGSPLPGGAQNLVLLGSATGASLEVRVGRGWHRVAAGSTDDGGTILSTNLEVVRILLGQATGPDRSMEDFLLGFGFLPDDRTVHRSVRFLGPGHHVVGAPAPGQQTPDTAGTDAGSTGTDTDASTEATTIGSFESSADVLHDRFMAALDGLSGPPGDVAVLLGGFDSALVAAGLVRLGHRVTTYTFGFGNPKYEQRNVGLVTRAIGSSERWVHIGPDTIMDGLRSFGRTYAQPGPQPHYQIHTLHACRQIRSDGFDAVFTGDGCDALFLGYPMVSMRARLMERLRRVPAPVTRTGLALASTRAADRRFGHVARMARSTLDNLLLPWPVNGHLPTRYLDETALSRLRLGPPPVQDESVEATRRRLAAGLGELDPVRVAFDGNARTGQSRVKVDGAVAATGVAQHSPFFQPELASFVATLPQEYLRPKGSAAGSAGKAVLIEMIRRNKLLPDEVVLMPKQSPVDAPVDEWYAGPLRAELIDLLEALPFEWDRAELDRYLAPKLVERLYRERIALGHHTFQAVGLLASYASFHHG